METGQVEETANVNPAPEHTPPPIAQPHEHRDDLRDIVHALSTRIDDLQEQVSSLTTESNGGDSKPNAKPWTHKKVF